MHNPYGVRPSVSLKAGTLYSSGDGSTINPYIIKTPKRLYQKIKSDSKDTTKYIKKYTGDTSTFKGDKDIYYYYGTAENNNVSFAGYCWKIIRTTDTGGVKLLYNGVTNASGTCNNTGAASSLTKEQMASSSSTVAFNYNFSSPADVGYMYNTRYTYNEKEVASSNFKYGTSFTWNGTNYTLTNTVDSSGIPSSINMHHYTCFNTTGVCDKINYIYYVNNQTSYYIIISDGKSIEDALNEMLYNDDVNKNNSNIKQAIDYWYQNNLTNYTTYLEDTVFCNDRNISNATTNGWNPSGGSTSTDLIFKPINDTNLTCKNKNDRFTVNTENGNGALTYPIGLIDIAETNLAYTDTNISPHKSGNWYWSLSPSYFTSFVSGNGNVSSEGFAHNGYVNGAIDIRPSISLKPSIEYSQGDGSSNNPFIVTTD